MYISMKDYHQVVQWRKILNGNVVRPRVNHILWMTFHDRLATKDRTNHFGLLENKTCCFYRNRETLQHLMFSYASMREICESVLSWLNINHIWKGWKDDLEWIIGNCQRKGCKVDILKCAFAETIYEVWLYRNTNYFGNKGKAKK